MLTGLRGLACGCCPPAVASGSGGQQLCRGYPPPPGAAAGAAEPRPPAEGNSPVAVPEEDEYADEDEESEVATSPESPVLQQEGRGQEVDVSVEQAPSRASSGGSGGGGAPSSGGGAGARAPVALRQQQRKPKVCAGKTKEGHACKRTCGENEYCAMHRSKRGRGRQGAEEVAPQQESKRRRLLEAYDATGIIEIDDLGSSYIATPCSDDQRAAPHPDSVDGQAPHREFSGKTFGEDAAYMKAQQYLMGERYANLAKK